MEDNGEDIYYEGTPQVRSRQVRICDPSAYITWWSSCVVYSGSNTTKRHENELLSFRHRYPLTHNEAFRYSGGNLPTKIEMGGNSEIVDKDGEGQIQNKSRNFKIISYE